MKEQETQEDTVELIVTQTGTDGNWGSECKHKQRETTREGTEVISLDFSQRSSTLPACRITFKWGTHITLTDLTYRKLTVEVPERGSSKSIALSFSDCEGITLSLSVSRTGEPAKLVLTGGKATLVSILDTNGKPCGVNRLELVKCEIDLKCVLEFRGAESELVIKAPNQEASSSLLLQKPVRFIDSSPLSGDHVRLSIEPSADDDEAYLLVSGQTNVGATATRIIRTTLSNICLKGGVSAFEANGSSFDRCRVSLSASNWAERDTTHHAPHMPLGTAFAKWWTPLKAWRRYRRTAAEWIPEIGGSCELKSVTFQNCRVATGVIASRCLDRSTIQLRHKTVHVDHWEALRDNYTGVLTALHLTPVVAYIAYVLLLVSGSYAASVTTEDLPAHWREVPIWHVLLFGVTDGGLLWKILNAASAIVLLLFNVMRVLLTVSVVKLRNREDHLQSQGFLLCRPDPEQYSWLAKLHRWYWVLLLVTVIGYGVKLVDVLGSTVKIPW